LANLGAGETYPKFYKNRWTCCVSPGFSTAVAVWSALRCPSCPRAWHRICSAHRLHSITLFVQPAAAQPGHGAYSRPLPGDRNDFSVWTTRKRVEELRDMHRNPAKRGLVEEGVVVME